MSVWADRAGIINIAVDAVLRQSAAQDGQTVLMVNAMGQHGLSALTARVLRAHGPSGATVLMVLNVMVANVMVLSGGVAKSGQQAHGHTTAGARMNLATAVSGPIGIMLRARIAPGQRARVQMDRVKPMGIVRHHAPMAQGPVARVQMDRASPMGIGPMVIVRHHAVIMLRARMPRVQMRPASLTGIVRHHARMGHASLMGIGPMVIVLHHAAIMRPAQTARAHIHAVTVLSPQPGVNSAAIMAVPVAETVAAKDASNSQSRGC